MSKLLTRIFFIILITPALSYAAGSDGRRIDDEDITESDNTAYDKKLGSKNLTSKEKNTTTTTTQENTNPPPTEETEDQVVEEETADEVKEEDNKVVEDTENNNTEPEKELTKEQQLAKVAELQENYDNMKEIENSFENRMLGATGMATMGIGGMQLATAMTEDRADDAAEQQMKAYLATFSCTYADGKRFSGGETAIELPGGNELINLYSEYVGLANDLKTRKEALGLRAGIEAQPILDSATSGLYDDISTGKASGAFTSLARALSDPNGADAAAWAAQRAETAEQKKTALTTIGVGAVATVAGNILINRNNEKERSAEILKKYEKLQKPLQEISTAINNLPNADNDHNASTTNPNPTYNDPEVTIIQEGVLPNQTIVTNTAQDIETTTQTTLTEFNSDKLFESGQHQINNDAKNIIIQYKGRIEEFIQKNESYCIEIIGHSDPTGWKDCDSEECNDEKNQILSQLRAEAVASELGLPKTDIDNKIIRINGVGSRNCMEYPPNYNKCRRVEIKVCKDDIKDNTQ